MSVVNAPVHFPLGAVSALRRLSRARGQNLVPFHGTGALTIPLKIGPRKPAEDRYRKGGVPLSVTLPNTTPLSCGSRLATMVYGLLLVIESWQLHVSSVTQVLTVLSIATLDSMHVLPIPTEA